MNSYGIQAILPNRPIQYLRIDFNQGQIEFTSIKKEATVFNSRMLVYGWMLRTRALFPEYTFGVIFL